MKIKLNRKLWNNESGAEIEVTDERADWAIGKGLAEKCITYESENKAIEPKYKKKRDAN